MWRMPQHLRGSDDAVLLTHARSGLADPESFSARLGEVYAQPELTTHDTGEGFAGCAGSCSCTPTWSSSTASW